MTRPSWDDYFMSIAYLVATRATCDRKKIGCVLVNPDKHMIATGYNGAPRGLPHCDDAGHELREIDGKMSCIRSLHAESNAIDQAGLNARNCHMYCVVLPCYDCIKRAVNAGIKRVVYADGYQSRNADLTLGFAEKAGIPIERWEGDYIIPEPVQSYISGSVK